MSMIRSIQKSRIVAIPLTRPSQQILKSPRTDGSRYTYYQFQIAAPPPTPQKSSSGAAKDSPPRTGLYGIIDQIKEKGVSTWAQGKAADTWAGFGEAKGGWKLKLYQGGEKIVDRLDFEELALKSLDPSMGPSIKQLKSSPKFEKDNAPPQIPVLFPPSILSPAEALGDLRAYAEHRIPRHKKGVIIWVLIMPLTAPFMIIPVIPNIPFFFCVWRAWSHYAAFRSSQYLQSLIDNDILVPQPSSALDGVYKRKQLSAPSPSPAASSDSESSTEPLQSSQSSETTTQKPENILLLTREDVPVVLSTLNLKPDSTAAVDIARAIEQARVRVSKGPSAV